MSYIGDYAEDYATLNIKFATVKSTGAPTVLSGTPVVKVYKGSATGTESTAGITLAVDFDSVVGLNNVLIDLSSDAFYATGQDYHVVITTGTVDSVSVVGYVVAEFSIENRFMRGTNSVVLSGPTKAEMDTAHALLATPAQVNTEVLDVLVTDTFAEPSSVPSATSSIKDKLNWLFSLARNKGTQTASTKTLRNDADSADIAASTVSDDGTTFTRGEWS